MPTLLICPTARNFKLLKVGRSRGSKCVILQNVVAVPLKPLPKYGDFSIFQDGGRRHLGFLTFQIINGRTAGEGRTASVCQIWSKSVKTRPRYGVFRFFKMAAAAILDFSNFKFLTAARLRNAELHRHAKCGRKSVKTRPRYGDFSIFQDGGRRHLGFFKFQIFNGRTTQDRRTA